MSLEGLKTKEIQKRNTLMVSLVDIMNVDEVTKKNIKEIEEKGENISLYLDNYQREELNIRGHANLYSISACNEKDKFSKSFHNCVGIIVSGIDKETKKPISILTHQNPSFFLDRDNPATKEELSSYVADLQDRLRQIQHSAVDGSLDVVLIGGQYADKQEYIDSMRQTSQFVMSTIGVKPTIITGPNTQPGIMPTNIYLNTKDRIIYSIRPENPSVANGSLSVEDIEKQWEAIEKERPKFKPIF